MWAAALALACRGGAEEEDDDDDRELDGLEWELGSAEANRGKRGERDEMRDEMRGEEMREEMR